MKTKLEMAHEWAMKIIEGNVRAADASDLLERAWQYADAMQAEADKREDKKQAERIKIYADAFMNCEIQVIDEDGDCRITTRQKELDRDKWQPDWSQAPNRAMYWAMDGCGQCNWYEREPEVFGSQWDWGSVIEQADTGYDYQGDWRNSLRKRPQ